MLLCISSEAMCVLCEVGCVLSDDMRVLRDAMFDTEWCYSGVLGDAMLILCDVMLIL